MENAVLKVDFDNMSYEQLIEFEEKAKEYKQKSLDRRVAELENWKQQTVSEMNILKQDNKELSEAYLKLKEQYDEINIKASKITETLLTHGIERRKLENTIHALVYKELKKDSLRDQLFHGLLTSKCKFHINKSLGVSAFTWIEVKDVSIAESLAKKYLNKTTIHNEMRNKSSVLYNKYQKLNNKPLTDKDIKRKSLLELLIEECEGDIYAI